MDKAQIKKIINSPLDYDESKEESYSSMVREFFSKRMRWVIIILYAWFFIFLVPLTFSIIQFVRTDQTKFHILYAAIFICSWLSIGILKIWALVVFQKLSLRREIKRLELRIAELNESINA